ncbi:MAG: hypothetical protein AAB898_00210 [Patescibacteria group bacterium]|mgnify:CR=1 FL=1
MKRRMALAPLHWSPMSTKYAHVALLRRLPRRATPFTYRLPEDLTAAVGSFVVVSLRGRRMTGVIVSISRESDVADPAAIQSVLDVPPLLERDLAFYNALRRRTYQSWHSTLHAAIPDVPKRNRESTTPSKAVTPLSIPERDVPVVQTIARHIHEHDSVRVALPSDRIGLACVATSVHRDPRPHLIVVGDLHTAETLVSILPSAALYGGIMSKSVAHERWLDIRLGRRTIVTTRMGALVPPSSATRVMVLGSGSDDLLQSDQNPHYDARWCVQQWSALQGNPVAFLDVLPRVEDGTLTQDVWQTPPVIIIDMSQARPASDDWLMSDELRDVIANADPSHGPFILYCNRVWKEGGPQTTTRDVADRLRSWFPQIPIAVVEANDPLPDHGLVVVTRTFLYRLSLIRPRASGVAIVRAEQELAYRGFRSLEQAARLLRRLTSWAASANAPCLIQTDAPDTVTAALGSTILWHASELA